MVFGLAVKKVGLRAYVAGCCHVLLCFLLVGCTAQQIKGRDVVSLPVLNPLLGSNNPYLANQATSPVYWYPWGKEVMETAKWEQKLLAIDIGTSACYPCRLQDRIVYRDSAVVEYMNRRFLSVKVDRFERPDLAKRYLSVLEEGDQGGWPLQIIALPDGRPLAVGNFLSPERWLLELKKQDAFWRGNQVQAERLASDNWRRIKERQSPPSSPGRLPEISLFENQLLEQVRQQDLGNHGAARFPVTIPYRVFLNSGDQEAIAAASSYLARLSSGSIYDHVGGGLMRCAEDPDWRYPCFEKTLYDNALFLSLMARQHELRPAPQLSETMYETREFLLREMKGRDGEFAAAMYPDSEGELGRYYLWPEIEVRAALGGSAGPYIRAFNITRNGNWGNGQNVLYRTLTDRELAAGYGMSEVEWNGYLFEQKRKMLAARQARVMPQKDPLWIVGWQGLLVSGFLDAYRATQDDSWLWYAIEIADRIRSQATFQDGGMAHDLLDGVPGTDAFLSDYAYVLEAYYHLYQVTLEQVWLDAAASLIRYVLAYHLLPGEGWFLSAPPSERDWLRQYDLYDNSLPSAQAVLGLQLLRFSWILEKPAYRDLARQMMRGMGETISDRPASTASWVLLAQELTTTPCVISLYGAAGKEWLDSQPVLPAGTYVRMVPSGTRNVVDPTAVVSIRIGLGRELSFRSFAEADRYLSQLGR